MDIDTMIEEIKVLLGYPTVNVELDDDSIEVLVNLAFKKIKPYICDRSFRTIRNTSVTTLNDVVDVINVYETISDNNSVNIEDPFNTLTYINYGNQLYMSYSDGLYKSEVETSVPKTFRFNNHVLYLSGYIGDKVTIEVYTEPTLETVEDERAQTWIYDYSIALCKESLGRIRSKYKSNTTPMELDGDALIQEAQQEKERLIQELSEQGYGEFIVLR